MVCEGADFLVDELERLRVLAADDPEVVDGLALHLRIDELGFDAVRELLVGELGELVEDEATESDRSTGISDQCASAQEPRTCVFRLRHLGLARWRNAHGGFKRL